MNKSLPFSLLLSALAVSPLLRAQTVATDPVGAVSITIKGNSDTIVAVPLTAMPNYSGAVASTAAGSGSSFNLNVSGTTGWTANQFANLYYVRMTSGAKNGMYYTITANTTGQVTVDTAGDNLAGIAAADTFKILKYWTLGTLFPPASAGTATNPLTASTSSAPETRKSEVLVPDPNGTGTYVGGSSPAYYFTSAGWFASTNNVAADNVLLFPDNPMIIRQPASITGDVAWSSVGSVSLSRVSTPLSTASSGPQDNPVALLRPVDLPLSGLGLETAFTQSASTALLARRDQLFVYDNSVASHNKSAAKIYYRTANSWRRAGADSVVADSDIVKAGDGFVIRKYKGDGNSVVWSNNPTY